MLAQDFGTPSARIYPTVSNGVRKRGPLVAHAVHHEPKISHFCQAICWRTGEILTPESEVDSLG